MARCKLRPRARADLVGIWNYTKSKWSDEQADEYIAAFEKAFEQLAENPLVGQSADHVRPNYRKQVCGSHVMFYVVKPRGIEIVRILHGRMDFPSQLK